MNEGISVREYFAAKAMAALMTDRPFGWTEEEVARHAVKQADALMAAISATPQSFPGVCDCGYSVVMDGLESAHLDNCAIYK